MITIENLSKIYGSNKVLNNVSATFKTGRIYGIVGRNGAGKTTLFNCIASLEKYSGNIYSNVEILKNHLGFLPTDNFFFDRMTGREYICFMCNARGKDANNLNKRNIFNLQLDNYIMTYSSGMKKKLAFMAVVMQDSDYYIFDEPFNGVDIESNMIMSEMILHLKKQGKCIILSSHIFSTLKEICDSIYIIENGQISEEIFGDNFDNIEESYKLETLGNKIDLFFNEQIL